MNKTVPDIDNEGGEVDDLDAMHPLDCICDECVDNLIIELKEERQIA